MSRLMVDGWTPSLRANRLPGADALADQPRYLHLPCQGTEPPHAVVASAATRAPSHLLLTACPAFLSSPHVRAHFLRKKIVHASVVWVPMGKEIRLPS